MAQQSNLLLRLAKELFPDRTEREAFVSALLHPQSCDAYLLWCQAKQGAFTVRSSLDWQPPFVDRIAPGQQPEKHALFRQGAYYPIEFNALFAISGLLSLRDRPGLVLDLCAASGGNSIFAWQQLQPKLLLANALLPKQRHLLLRNLRRCGITPAATMSVDVAILAQVIPAIADLVILQAPSTVQSLLARGQLNPGCFHPVSIHKYAKRQRRLMAHAVPLVAPQGHLLYSTSTYSLEENERVIEWFLDRFPQFIPCQIPHLSQHQSPFTPVQSYRLFPHQELLPHNIWGVGSFTTLLQNNTPGQPRSLPPRFLTQPRITLV